MARRRIMHGKRRRRSSASPAKFLGIVGAIATGAGLANRLLQNKKKRKEANAAQTAADVSSSIGTSQGMGNVPPHDHSQEGQVQQKPVQQEEINQEQNNQEQMQTEEQAGGNVRSRLGGLTGLAGLSGALSRNRRGMNRSKRANVMRDILRTTGLLQ